VSQKIEITTTKVWAYKMELVFSYKN